MPAHNWQNWGVTYLPAQPDSFTCTGATLYGYGSGASNTLIVDECSTLKGRNPDFYQNNCATVRS
jgi:hypothetical protein